MTQFAVRLASADAADRDPLASLLEELLRDRPKPLRRYDQIHMRLDDLAAHIRIVAPAAEGKNLLVMGDSDGLVVGLLCAGRLGIVPSPRQIVFCDFDRRVVQFVKRTARRLGLADVLSAHLYNVFEPLPAELLGSADLFHTNPPYGQFNAGRSVLAFVERCLAGVRPGGEGVIITANDSTYAWTRTVLSSILASLVSRRIVPYRIDAECHNYELDDQPDLRSGVIWCDLAEATGAESLYTNLPDAYAECFYGRVTIPIPRYISHEGEDEQLLLFN